MYIFYPDIYWAIQSIICLFWVMVTKTIVGKRISGKRIAFVVFISSVIETIAVIIMPSVIICKLFVHIVVVPGSVALAFKPGDKKEFGKEWLLCYMSTWFLDGCVQCLYNETGWTGIIPVVMCSVLLYFIIWVVLFFWKRRPNYYKIELEYNDIKLCAKGMLDSGNLLYDPIYGKPVSMVSKEFLEPILRVYDRPMMPILCKTIAGTNTTNIVTVDILRIKMEGMQYVTNNAKLGISELAYFGNASCKLLIHKEHMTTRGEESCM